MARRGRCSGCGRVHAIDDDGMVRRHRPPGSPETGPISQSHDLCLGSYELPREAASGADPFGLASSA